MSPDEKVDAILFIRPNAQFTLHGDELEWLDTEQDKPTDAEIQAGFIAFQAKVKADEEAAENAKLAAEAKLKALGLTIEDLKALGIG